MKFSSYWLQIVMLLWYNSYYKYRALHPFFPYKKIKAILVYKMSLSHQFRLRQGKKFVLLDFPPLSSGFWGSNKNG